MPEFISGFLALCSAVGAGSATEITAPGYNRQPMVFGNAISGVAVSGMGFDFGSFGYAAAQTAGRAIYDSPTGGNLLAVLPHAAPRLPAGGSLDRGEAGAITLILSALADFPDGGAFNGTFQAGAVLGLVYDAEETIGLIGTQPNPAAGITALPRRGQFLQVAASTLTAGVALTVTRGMARAT